MQQLQFNAFRLSVAHFFLTGRQFGFTTAVHDINMFGTQTHGSSCGIHGHVATAYHGYLFAYIDRCSNLRELIGTHQVDAG